MPAVPRSGLATTEGSPHLFVLRDGRIEERSVRLGAELGDDVGIAEGVVAGERVVTRLGPDVTNGVFAN